MDKLSKNELFEEYVENFKKSANYKRIVNKKITKRYSQEDKNSELKKAQIYYVKKIEQEKVTYFAIANAQSREVVVVKPLTNKKEDEKQFLGYEWSKRKGQEGIKYIGENNSDGDTEISKRQAINNIKTPLFNPINLMDSEKINTVIRNNFVGKLGIIPTQLDKFVNKFTLIDMLDFTQPSFDAQIKTAADKKFEIISEYPLEKLDKIADIKKGTTIKESQTRPGNVKVVAGGRKYAYMHDTSNRTGDIITISASGTNAGFVNYWDEPIFASDTITVQTDNVQETKYIYNFLRLQQEMISESAKGSAQTHVYPKYVSKILIPQAPDEVQKKIIQSVEKLDKEFDNSRMTLEKYREKLSCIFQKSGIQKNGVE